jgi:microcystin degradation protein MlrC
VKAGCPRYSQNCGARRTAAVMCVSWPVLRSGRRWALGAVARVTLCWHGSHRRAPQDPIMPRIAVGGFHHETNTFSATPATYEDFVVADGWPGLTRGDDILTVFRDRNIGLCGFLDVARERGWMIVPALWCQANPSGRPTADAYERVAGELVARIKSAHDSGPLDAVYLCLHGAMATEHLDDGEGELMRRVRAVVGYEIPLVASLDFHANITAAMVSESDAMAAYRTYPHLDIAETGRRAARLLARILETGGKPAKAFRHLPYIIPLTQQCTLIEPAKGVAAAAEALQGEGVTDVSFAAGFPPADVPECGPAILAYGWDARAVEAAAASLYARCLEAEKEFAAKLWQPDEAVGYAIRQSNYAKKPIVLADTQDNPGAGGDSDTVGILAELVKQDAPDAVLGLLYDPATAAAAHKAGPGAVIERTIGCVSRAPGHVPLKGRFIVEALSDGSFATTGPMYKGFHMELGPMAVLRVDQGRRGVRVVVSSRKQQAADQAVFAHIGIDPAAPKILVLKSSVHFRNHFQDLAEEILIVLAPGPNIEDPAKLPYRKLRAGVRLRPLGPEHRPA